MPDIIAIKRQQQDLKDAGFYTGKIDGLWGAKSKAAMTAAIAARTTQQATKPIGIVSPDFRKIAWGKLVSQEFKDKVQWIVDQLGMPQEGGADNMMSCMAWESNGTFSPKVKNMAGSGATGLIQFMPKTAIGLGTTVAALAAMTAVEQLDYVYKYFLPFRGKLNNLSDVYMAILYPIAVGKPENYVLFDRDTKPIAYRQNGGLDFNRNGQITKHEAAAKVYAKLAEGAKYLG